MIAEIVMDIIRTRRERRIQKEIDRVVAEARVQIPKVVRSQILAEARGRILAECLAWNRRRLDAEARGEPFDEPFPYSDAQHGENGKS